MNNNLFKGTGVALITPFQSDGSVDFKGLEKLVNNLVENGVDYLVVLGTTGETVTLSDDEQDEVVRKVKEYIDKRVPLVLGMGGNNTLALVEKMKKTDFEGVSAILSASPSYNKPTQEGIYQHYKKLSENSPLPIILYNVPGRTASNMTAETTLRLAKDFSNIIGIKEASGNMEQVMQILKNAPKDFLTISGEDSLTLPMIACGGHGVISVVANAFPKEYSQMVNDCLKNDFEAAKKLHYFLLDIIGLLFVEGNPGGVKAALKIKGVCGDTLRLPLVNLGSNTYGKLQKAIESL